jgi:hypothetical protein
MLRPGEDRCLKRRLSDAVYRRLVRDAHPDTATGPRGHQGRLPNPRGRLNPYHRLVGQVTPRTANTNTPKDHLNAERREEVIVKQDPGERLHHTHRSSSSRRSAR